MPTRSSGGGFLLPSAGTDDGSTSYSDLPLGSRNRRSGQDGGEEEEPLVQQRLTERQESRLMAHLEERFAEIGRGWNKRNQPTSTLPDMSSFLAAWQPVLSVLASIPSAGPSASLQISYLLRATTEILEGVRGYFLSSSDEQTDTSQPIQRGGQFRTSGHALAADHASMVEGLAPQLLEVLKMVDLLDRCWAVLLRGQAIDFVAARENAARAMTLSMIRSSASRPVLLDELERRTNASLDSPLLHRGRQYANRNAVPPTSGAGIRAQMAELQHAPPRPNGRPVFNSKGYRTVGATERVRLRNVVVEGKERCFEWMRDVCHRPAPPKAAGDGEEKETGLGETVGGQGDLEMKGLNTDGKGDVDGIVTGDEESDEEEGDEEREDEEGRPARKRQKVEDVGEGPKGLGEGEGEGDLKGDANEDEEEGLDMEEVPLDGDGNETEADVVDAAGAGESGVKLEPDVDAPSARDGLAMAQGMDEAGHFEELFASKFDPDEDDESEEEREGGQDVEGERGEDAVLSEPEEEEEEEEEEKEDVKPDLPSQGHLDASDTEAIEESDDAAPSSTLAYDLDVQFSRLFSRTLGILAEIVERGGREGVSRAGGVGTGGGEGDAGEA